MPRNKNQFDEMRLQTIHNLKQAGLMLFAKKGLAATNIKEIAAEAHVSLGLIYHYYKSKEDLYLSLVNEAMEMSQGIVDQLNQYEGSFREKISLFIDAFLHGVQKEDGMYYFIIFSQSYTTGKQDEDRQLQEKKLQAIRNLAAFVQQGQQTGEAAEGDPFQLAATFISTTQGIASFKLMFGERFMLPDREILIRILLK